ncbi:hypothetical protein XA68_17706 [Ophiocordyceps unilateralis]|uniref:Uncharacterized protein n=1 Tax=Ophiocordyceps unilateralis TaxID=268505 RepID=A0A2A9P4B1_OPHUN|nr:hypothetical protein XA68_17706 [Ophiocordyceps unilateralis]
MDRALVVYFSPVFYPLAIVILMPSSIEPVVFCSCLLQANDSRPWNKREYRYIPKSPSASTDAANHDPPVAALSGIAFVPASPVAAQLGRLAIPSKYSQAASCSTAALRSTRLVSTKTDSAFVSRSATLYRRMHGLGMTQPPRQHRLGFPQHLPSACRKGTRNDGNHVYRSISLLET